MWGILLTRDTATKLLWLFCVLFIFFYSDIIWEEGTSTEKMSS